MQGFSAAQAVAPMPKITEGPKDKSRELQMLGEIATNIAVRMQNEEDDIDAKTGLSNYESSVLNVRSKYLETQREHSRSYFQPTIDELEKQKESALKNAKNDRVRNMISDAIERTHQRTLQDAHAHYSKQMNVLWDDASKGRIESHVNNAVASVTTHNSVDGEYNIQMIAAHTELSNYLRRQGFIEGGDAWLQKHSEFDREVTAKAAKEMFAAAGADAAKYFVSKAVKEGKMTNADAKPFFDHAKEENEREAERTALDKIVSSIQGIPFASPAEWKPVVDGGAIVSSKYGEVGVRDHVHRGVDYAVKEGTGVIAPAAGSIIEIGEEKKGGKFLTMETVDGHRVTFRHLSRNDLFSAGDSVSAGTMIASSGNTGTSTTGPHLHVEVVKDGKTIDPQEKFIPKSSSYRMAESLVDAIGGASAFADQHGISGVKKEALIQKAVNIWHAKSAEYKAMQDKSFYHLVDSQNSGVPFAQLPSKELGEVNDKQRGELVEREAEKNDSVVMDAVLSGQVQLTDAGLRSVAHLASPKLFNSLLKQAERLKELPHIEKSIYDGILRRNGLTSYLPDRTLDDNMKLQASNFQIRFRQEVGVWQKSNAGKFPTLDVLDGIAARLGSDRYLVDARFWDDKKNPHVDKPTNWSDKHYVMVGEKKYYAADFSQEQIDAARKKLMIFGIYNSEFDVFMHLARERKAKEDEAAKIASNEKAKEAEAAKKSSSGNAASGESNTSNESIWSGGEAWPSTF
jgi:murein DD-endopeptidase MepM/ murein hydrolase activator NlpD